MRIYIFSFFVLISFSSFSQDMKNKIGNDYEEKEKYISMNFFSIAEPQFAFGLSFGNRFTERSEYFIELSYVTKTPFYDWKDFERLRGARIIAQYRYHFLQQWRPLINFGAANRRRRERHQPFMGIEFRVKPISFITSGNFINTASNDTLVNYSFSANAFTYGGTLIFGKTFTISADEKWKLELTMGIGAKQRDVKLKTVPAGYKVLSIERIAFQTPPLQEAAGGVLIPLALRIRYTFD